MDQRTHPARQRQNSFGDLLKQWRSTRRLSQLDLASEAAISSRHLSFLETGRAQPSREMIELLGNALDIPFAAQNDLFLAAGFAPKYATHEIDAPELEHVRRALEFILKQQEPFPALVLDEAWNVRMRNAAAERIFRIFRTPGALPENRAQNAMHSLCHPMGVRRYVTNWDEFIGPLIQSLHREATAGNNPAITNLLDELLRYPGVPARWKAGGPTETPPLLSMRLKKDDVEFNFFTTLTTFANPHEVTLQHLRVECLFPADKATEETARRMAEAKS